MSKKKQKSMEELLEEALVPEEEQPYKVPENWVWVRLGSVISSVKGKKPKELLETKESKSIPYVTIDYLTNGVTEETKYVPEQISKVRCNKEDILMVWDGARSGFVGRGGEGEVGSTLAKIEKRKFDTGYLYYFLKSKYEYINNNHRGTGIPHVNPEVLWNIPFPVSPLNEQKRIAEKIERLFAKIDEAKRLIEEVKGSFELRRAAILDKAIKGELVSQSPLDESADNLLKYIEEQKHHLVKQKKSKKEKPLPSVEQNELLYNIPENWCWVRLGEVIELISGRDVSAKECNNEGVGVPYIMGASNIADDSLIIERWIEKPSVVGKKGDVLLSVKGTVGKTIIQEVEEAHLSRQIMGLRPIHVHNGYLKIFIQTYVQVLKEKSKGVIPGISREDVLLAPFPLPPYNEQKRIAEKVDILLSKLETEKEMVLEVEQKLNSLKQSILNKAFRGELGTNDPTDEHAIELLKEVLKSK